MWRVLGDEIIFIIPIKEKQDFFVYTDKIFEILNNFVYQLKTGKFFDELEADDAEKLLMKTQNIISLKAAAWIAIVGEEIQQIERYDNLLERYKLREGYGLIEFLGNDVKVYGNLDSIVKCAAVCTGSGKSMIKDVIKAGADVYVTGDIDHHTGIDTVAQGLALIDAGHYGTEYIFMDAMKKELTQAFPELKISCAEVKSPYTIL